MKSFSRHFGWVLLVVLAFSAGQAAAQGPRTYTNVIEGRVTGPTNQGVNNAWVELYSNFGVMVAKARSTGQGRFTFRNIGAGGYVVSVKPFGTNLKEANEDIEIVNQGSSMDLVVVNIQLQEDKRGSLTPTVLGTVYAQEVPQEAKRRYRNAIDELQSPNPSERAYTDLEEALRIFPTYFDALAALGKAYIIKGKHEQGYPYLLRAIDVNNKCGDCYYSLALAFHQLDKKQAATMAIDAAGVLQGQSPSVRLLQGRIHRVNKDYAGAEKALLIAKKLYKEPNPEVHYELGLVYNKLDRNKEAADELETYLKVSSDMKDAEKRQVRDLIGKLRTGKEKGTSQ